MDNIRPLLLISLCLVGFLIWEAWEKDYGTHQHAPVATPSTTVAPDATPRVSEDPAPLRAQQDATPVTVTTDVFRAQISSDGSTLVRLELLRFPTEVARPDEPFVLLSNDPSLMFTARSGILSDSEHGLDSRPFTPTSSSYTLDPGKSEVTAVFIRSEPGLTITKKYLFKRGDYSIDVSYEVRNTGTVNWNGRVYAELARMPAPTASMFGIHTYTGAALSSPEKRYERVTFESMKSTPVARDLIAGWAAMLQHYFVTAIIPPADASHHYYSKALADGRFLIGLSSPVHEIKPDEAAQLSMRMYLGPKLQNVLEAIAPGLDLTVDYGVLWFIAKPLYWLLETIHSLIGNWGWAIVLLTVLVKVAFFRLSAASYRSMAKMRKVQPRLASLRERYGDDRTRLNEAMMQMYKEEKINPLGGCLPIVIQIPVFLSLYWVLLESVELRHAPFMFWISDLSTKDPYFVLPILMGITMFVQQQLNPAPPDPVQARVMQVLPIVFTFLFLMFPAGLVLYWFVNNTLSILQQWVITREIDGTGSPSSRA